LVFNELLRLIVVSMTGAALSLGIGAMLSTLPESPLEGLYTGVIITSVLFVLVFYLLVRVCCRKPAKVWLFGFHSMLGLASGLFLSVVLLSGAILLVSSELNLLSNPWLAVKTEGEHVPVDAWLDAVGRHTDLDQSSRIDIEWPTIPQEPARISVMGRGGFTEYFVDPYRATVLEGEFSGWVAWVKELHVSLHFDPVGRILAGLSSVVALWLVISGIVMERGLFRDWRVLRVRSGIRTFLTDFHKRIAVWLLPFIVLISFTGIFFALFNFLSVGPARFLFDGNLNFLYEAQGAPPRVSRTSRAPMPRLNRFVSAAKEAMPEATVSNIRIMGYGDRDAVVSVRATRPWSFAPSNMSLITNFHAGTGEVLWQKSLEDYGPFYRMYLAMYAFHAANDARKGVRVLYIAVTIAFALMPLLGLAMWALRTRKVPGR